MKAKCPFCECGCDKCDGGFIEIIVYPGEWLTRVCANEEECGFVNGESSVRFELMMTKPDPCVNCGGPCVWRAEDYVPSSQGWRDPKNQVKWMSERNERTIESLVARQMELIHIGRRLVHGDKLTLNDFRLLGICRICHEPESTPFVLDFGNEYAHWACLVRELKEPPTGQPLPRAGELVYTSVDASRPFFDYIPPNKTDAGTIDP